MISEQAWSFLDAVAGSRDSRGKTGLARELQDRFNLTKDRSVYYSDTFAVRFSSSSTSGFSNTVLSLSSLQKYDEMPFFVCLVTPTEVRVHLANSTLLKKVSHSSQELRQDNIRGSFNGSDIVKSFNGWANIPANFEELFAVHSEIGFSGNLPRLVEATTGIVAVGAPFKLSPLSLQVVRAAPLRASQFVASSEYVTLKNDLDERVSAYSNEILIAGLIENTNIRGRVIEYLIAGEDDTLRNRLVQELRGGSGFSRFRTRNTLGDYARVFDNYNTVTDIKTKIMVLNANPKAYNLDKVLEFLASEKSVFMMYFVGLGQKEIVAKTLVSMFQTDLVAATILLKHWAGRNSRGVAQFEGRTVHRLLNLVSNSIDLNQSALLLERIIDLSD